MIYEAICQGCGETFNPAGPDDLIHGLCGGRGILLGAWGTPPVFRNMPKLAVAELAQVTSAVRFYEENGFHDFDGQIDDVLVKPYLIHAYHLMTHPRYAGDPDECADCLDECR